MFVLKLSGIQILFLIRELKSSFALCNKLSAKDFVTVAI